MCFGDCGVKVFWSALHLDVFFQRWVCVPSEVEAIWCLDEGYTENLL